MCFPQCVAVHAFIVATCTSVMRMLLCATSFDLLSRSQGNSRNSTFYFKEETLFFFCEEETHTRRVGLAASFFGFVLFIFTSPISFGICRSRAIPRTNESARDRSNRRYETNFFYSFFFQRVLWLKFIKYCKLSCDDMCIMFMRVFWK